MTIDTNFENFIGGGEMPDEMSEDCVVRILNDSN